MTEENSTTEDDTFESEVADIINNTPKTQRVMYSMKEEEKLLLATGLQKYHSVFKKFWQISTIMFSNEIATAAVYCREDGAGMVIMKINPDFWAEQTSIQKLWIICHECLHVILDHFSRAILLEHKGLANKMMDIVINHTTIEKFGFKRSEIDPDNRYCWLDKFFYPEDNVPHGQSFEYYYNEILKYPDRHGNGSLLDDHMVMTDEQFKDFIKQMNKTLSPEEKETLKDWLKKQMAGGSGSGGMGGEGVGTGDGVGDSLWTFDNIGFVKKKKKWETVIKNWIVKTVGMEVKPREQWVFEDRRMSLLPKTMCLPHTRDEDDFKKKKEKIDLFFFLDTSGSCFGFGERFFKAARSIPTDKFNIHLYNFDTSVYDVDINKAEVMGGGGTTFHIIEERIQQVIREKGINYPKAVWIVTDGEGNPVEPEIPENWFWFMTEYFSDAYVNKKSKIYKLNDYE